MNKIMEDKIKKQLKYVRLDGLVSPPLFDGVRVIDPATVGVMGNV